MTVGRVGLYTRYVPPRGPLSSRGRRAVGTAPPPSRTRWARSAAAPTSPSSSHPLSCSLSTIRPTQSPISIHSENPCRHHLFLPIPLTQYVRSPYLYHKTLFRIKINNTRLFYLQTKENKIVNLLFYQSDDHNPPLQADISFQLIFVWFVISRCARIVFWQVNFCTL